MYADQPGYKMAKSLNYDENANIQPDASFRLKRVEVPRLCHQILKEEYQWAQHKFGENLRPPRHPQNFAMPQHVPLLAMNREGVSKSSQLSAMTKPFKGYHRLLPEPIHDVPRTPSTQLPPGPSSLVAKSVGLAEIRREKLSHKLKNAESMDDMQSKLNDLDEALRDSHLSVPSVPKPFNYITYMKRLQKQQPIKKRELTIEEKNEMKKLETMVLPKKVQHKSFEPNPGKCCCERPISKVVCYFCLYTQVGRKMIVCPKHPKMIYLSDVSACPRCKSTTYLLEKIKE